MKSKFCILLIAALPATAPAQQREAPPHPADPAAKALPARYESAFAGYRAYREEKLAPWREVNDEVGRVGGHVGMFRSQGAGQGAARPEPRPPARGTAQ